MITIAAEILVSYQLMERIRFEELSRFDTEFEHAWRLATDVLHSPELQGQLRMTQACRYLVCGDLERGTGLIEPGNQSLQDLGTTWREPDRFILDSCQMLLTGTLAGHAEQMAARLAQPNHPSIPHLAAPPPRSWTWIQPIAYWAQVATALEVPDPARLHDQFAPHAGELAIVGVAGDCGGAIDSLLAGLAWRLGRPGEATERAQAGLAPETRVGSRYGSTGPKT